MRTPPRQFDLISWQESLNTQLRVFFGFPEQPAELMDTLTDIKTRLANQELLLEQLVQAVAPTRLQAESPATQSPTLPPPRPFEFSDFNQPPVINGNTKPMLTRAEFNILTALTEAGPRGLSMDDLYTKSGHSDGRKYLKKLAEDVDWRSVILFPQKGRGGYRLRFS